jgi:hypothetical protein
MPLVFLSLVVIHAIPTALAQYLSGDPPFLILSQLPSLSPSKPLRDSLKLIPP